MSSSSEPSSRTGTRGAIRLHQFADRLRELGRRAARAKVQRKCRLRFDGRRQVHLRRRRAVLRQPRLQRRLDDADNADVDRRRRSPGPEGPLEGCCPPPTRLSRATSMAAESRGLSRAESRDLDSCSARTSDSPPPPAGVSCRSPSVKPRPATSAQADGLEQVATRVAADRDAPVFRRIGRMPHDDGSRCGALSERPDGRVACHAGGFHARQPRRSRDEIAVEASRSRPPRA